MNGRFSCCLETVVLICCHICIGIVFQTVGPEIEEARSASFVLVLGMKKVWLEERLLVEECRQCDVLVAV